MVIARCRRFLVSRFTEWHKSVRDCMCGAEHIFAQCCIIILSPVTVHDTARLAAEHQCAPHVDGANLSCGAVPISAKLSLDLSHPMTPASRTDMISYVLVVPPMWSLRARAFLTTSAESAQAKRSRPPGSRARAIRPPQRLVGAYLICASTPGAGFGCASETLTLSQVPSLHGEG